MPTQTLVIKRYAFLIGLFWTLLIILSYAFFYVLQRNNYYKTARAEAHIAFQKDTLYRKWVSNHGGVYVPITEQTPPNPNLSHIPERDIQTPSGKQLTLVNPAYMTRQVFEQAAKENNFVQGHITSLKPIRPENAPDPWEQSALKAFEAGPEEVSSVGTINGRPYMRLMHPFFVEQPCLKCHAAQGYKLGDIRGGISVSVPMSLFTANSWHLLAGTAGTHFLIWALGTSLISFGSRKLSASYALLQDKNTQLEAEICEREAAQEQLQEQACILEEEIIEKQQAEEILSQSEERFRMAIVNAPFPIMIHADDGQVVQVSSAWSGLSGYALSDIPTISDWTRKAYGVNQYVVKEYIDKLYNLGTRVDEGEYKITAQNGETRVWDFSSAPLGLLSDGRRLVISMAKDVTERKLMEERIREHEEDLVESQRIAQLGSWRLDVASNHVVWSKELYKIYGFDPTLPVPPYTEHQKLFTPESWNTLTAALAKTVETGIPYELELETVRKDGSCGWLWVYGEAILDENSVAVSLRGAAQDITRRKETELEVLVSKTKLKSALDSMTDAIFISDTKGHFIEFNDAFATYHKFTNKDDCAKTFAEYPDILDVFMANGDPAPVEQWAVPRALRGEIGTNIEYTLRRKDSGETWIGSYCFAPIRDMGGVVVGSVVTGRDITEQKKVENDIRRLTTMLNESQHLAKVGGWEVDLIANTLYWSDETYRLHDTSPSEYTPTLESALAFYAPESLSLITTAVKEAIDQDKDYNLELKLITAKGRPILVHTTCKIIRKNGKPVKILGAFKDITDQKHLEEQLRQSQKMEAIGQLAGGVAHDFNNILTVIMGYASLLRMGMDLNDQQKDAVEQIIASSERASQLTSGLLAFSRKQVLSFNNENLADIVHHVEKFLIRIIGEDIQFKSIHSGQRLPVNVDKSQIEQVLINLAANARDAMQKGGMLTIEIGLQEVDAGFEHAHNLTQSGSFACISVSDNGCGMDEETSSKIFEPFFTTKEVGKGTGLGMAIVYGIIQQHNGFINVYSEPGVGTTFRIYLPAIETQLGDNKDKETLLTPEGGIETILVAEDDADVRKLVSSVLSKFGYKVIQAEDGQEAVDKFIASHEKISLILMDMIMPKKNGKEAYEEISRIKPGQKILFSSGYTADFIKSRGVSEEGIELIMKPVQPIELLRKVRELLDSNQTVN
jgi:PAS domain S-box-containing protein